MGNYCENGKKRLTLRDILENSLERIYYGFILWYVENYFQFYCYTLIYSITF
jgi:hypothetical protein